MNNTKQALLNTLSQDPNFVKIEMGKDGILEVHTIGMLETVEDLPSLIKETGARLVWHSEFNLPKEFKREHRYYVLKNKDIHAALNESEIRELNRIASKITKHRISEGKSYLECVVVEKGWEGYEAVWEMIKNLAQNS